MAQWELAFSGQIHRRHCRKGWQPGVPECMTGQRWKGRESEKTCKAERGLVCDDGVEKQFLKINLFKDSANVTGLKLLARSEVVPWPEPDCSPKPGPYARFSLLTQGCGALEALSVSRPPSTLTSAWKNATITPVLLNCTGFKLTGGIHTPSCLKWGPNAHGPELLRGLVQMHF